MPAVMKVYCEAESHPSIRAIIEFAINRFFALHQESFIFQTCDVLSNVVALPDVDGAALCHDVFTLFSTLKGSAPLTHPEVAAISALTRPRHFRVVVSAMMIAVNSCNPLCEDETTLLHHDEPRLRVSAV